MNELESLLPKDAVWCLHGWNCPSSSREETWISFTQGWFAQSVVKDGLSVLGETTVFKVSQCIFLHYVLRYYLSLEKFVALHLYKIQDALCQVCWFWKTFKFHQCIFAISLLSPLEKGHNTPFEKNFNTFHPRICLCQVYS